MGDDTLSFILSRTEGEFESLLEDLNFWILSPIQMESISWSQPAECFFSKWVDTLETSRPFLSNDESTNLTKCLREETEPLLKNVLSAQSGLLFSIGDLAVSDVGFASLMLNIDRNVLSRLASNWLSSNKFSSISELPPIFNINPKISIEDINAGGEISILAIENALYSFKTV
ncbi:hypothetical protein ACRN9G_18670 [Shewanella frigidimarina]|uniref:hypothetical protein n=1 Tax=Shewanella frigidimarina TaxID=56812 RepID=UPI003D79D1D6